MQMLSKKIVLCEGLRTPIGHLSKSLADILPEKLLVSVMQEIMARAKLDPACFDGAIVGWVGQGSHAPNVARICALQAGLPEAAYAYTIQCNCVSGIEVVAAAARRILMGEGELYLAGGTESMSTFPYVIRGARSKKFLRSIENLKKNWESLWGEPDIEIIDCISEGLTDPYGKINMAQTAEVCAQKFSISRGEQDSYAFETFSRCIAGGDSGFYAKQLVPVADNGTTVLQEDEYPALRKNLVKSVDKFVKAPVLFDSAEYPFEDFYREFGAYIDNKSFTPGETGATVTLFNSCARSDGAACLIVTTEEKARQLGLRIMAEVKGWGFVGSKPAYMGIAPAYATRAALEHSAFQFSDMSNVELHEAFAATVLSTFKVGKDLFGHDWHGMWSAGKLNRYGGSIPLGHPLAATGTRLLINLMYAMQDDPAAKLGLAAACASGGVGGAMVLEKAG